MIVLDRLSLTLGEHPILHTVSCEILPGECVCFSGPGGAGKTALMTILTGEKKPTQGTVTIDSVNLHALSGADLQFYRRHIGIVEQESHLLPDANVAQNIALPLRLEKASPAKQAKRVTDLLISFDLLAKADHLPRSLTMSERRKVALARALARAPLILLLDEPLQALDDLDAALLFPILRNEHKRGATLIMMSRKPEKLAFLSPRTIQLQGTRKTSSRRFSPTPIA